MALAERDAARIERDAALAAVAAAEAAQMVAEDARDAAMAAAAAAETAREAAVAAQAAAVAAQAAAETDRDTAMAAEAAAVAAQATADAAREAAVAAQVAADADRDNAQLQRDAALAAQASAEADRGSALAAQASAEADRDAAISAQTAAETARDLAAAAQMAAERDRDLAEAAQMAAETAREAAVAAQIAADIARVAAEGARDDAQAQREAAMTAQTAAEAARDAAISAQTAAETARDAARSERDDARIQLAVAQSALDTARDDLTQARTDATLDAIEIARLGGEVTRLEGEVEDLEGDVAQLNMDLTAAELQLAELLERQSEGNLTASNVAELIDLNTTRNTDDVADTAMFGGAAMVSVSHPHGSNRTVAGSRMVLVDDDADADTPTPYTSYAAPRPLGAGWYGSAFDMTMAGGAHRIATVYTDVEAPKRENFAQAYGGLADMARYHTAMIDDPAEGAEEGAMINVYVDSDGDPILGTDDAPLVVGTATAPEGAVRADQIGTGDFADEPKAGYPAVPEASRAMDSWVADAPESRVQFWALVGYDRNAETTYCGPGNTAGGCNSTGGFSGSFDGVRGVFRCAVDEAVDSECSVVRSGEGTADDPYLLSSADAWLFTANNSATNVRTLRLDGDYLTMGWWIQKPDRAAGTYMFSRYVDGADPYTGTAAAGTAKYSGPAAGIWAERDRELEDADFGPFTATANINADFGDNMVDGTIDDFVLGDGTTRRWVVDLGEKADGAGVEGPTSGSADGRSWTGMWDSTFYGNRSATTGNTNQPTYVAGSFRASFGEPELDPMADTSQGQEAREDDTGFVGVSGVYGAELQEEME